MTDLKLIALIVSGAIFLFVIVPALFLLGLKLGHIRFERNAYKGFHDRTRKHQDKFQNSRPRWL